MKSILVPIPYTIARSLASNQVTIIAWKKKRKNHIALAMLWECVDNSIFLHVEAYKIVNEA